MVLDELHVLQRRSRPVGHGHPVPGLDVAVGGEGEDPAASAGAEHDGLGQNGLDPSGGQIQSGHPHAFAVVHQQRCDEPLVVPADPGKTQGVLEEAVEHVEPGLVRGEHGPLDAHAPERPNADAPVPVPAPRTAPMLQLKDLFWSGVHEKLHSVLVRQVVASANRVETMQVVAVVVAQHGRRAALGRHGMAAHGVDLGDHHDVQVRLHLDCRHRSPQPSRPAAHDQKITRQCVHIRARILPHFAGRIQGAQPSPQKAASGRSGAGFAAATSAQYRSIPSH